MAAWTKAFLAEVMEQVRVAPHATVTDEETCSRCGVRPVESGWHNFCPYCGATFVPEHALVEGRLSNTPAISD